MRIGVDGREIQDGVYTGIGRALYDFLKYADLKADDEVIVFSGKPLPVKFFSRVRNHVMKEWVGFIWDQVQLPVAIKQERIDIFYSPYYKLPLLAPCRKVCAVLDLINFKFDAYRHKMSLADKLLFKFVLPLHMRSADMVVTCSEHARKDIFAAYGFSREKVVVVPLTVSDCFHADIDSRRMLEVREQFGIRGSYILYAGNFKLHKNVETLVDAFADLAKEVGHLSLVLSGPKTHGYAALVKRCLKEGVQDRVIFTDKVLDEEVSQLLYAGAEVCVMPSLYEGFGLPPLEAMACGTPVVCARATSLPEVAEDAAIFVNPFSASEMAQGIRGLMRHEDIRRAFVYAGFQQAAKFRSSVIMPRMFNVIKDAGV
ncbi:MAG: glycosyltransferase family 4 protein [Candidatus Omnitrophica bacterium]|nr:glycosyltransferase family 4 protein [Candidatus Omnitrophota bacterium]